METQTRRRTQSPLKTASSSPQQSRPTLRIPPFFLPLMPVPFRYPVDGHLPPGQQPPPKHLGQTPSPFPQSRHLHCVSQNKTFLTAFYSRQKNVIAAILIIIIQILIYKPNNSTHTASRCPGDVCLGADVLSPSPDIRVFGQNLAKLPIKMDLNVIPPAPSPASLVFYTNRPCRHQRMYMKRLIIALTPRCLSTSQ